MKSTKKYKNSRRKRKKEKSVGILPLDWSIGVGRACEHSGVLSFSVAPY